MAARQKVAAEPILKSWDEVDDTLLHLAEHRRRQNIAEAKANERIAAIRDKLADELHDDLAAIARAEKDLKEFAEYHKASLGAARSRKLNHGVIGFRRSTELATLASLTWAKVVDLLKSAKRVSFLRTKEEVDKEAVRAAALPPEELEACGMRMVDKDTFYYELAEVEAQPTS